jgi:hypothetical protein
MKLQKSFIAGLTMILLLCGILVNAQQVDISGKWKLNTSKSSLSYDFSLAPKQLNIVQEENALSMERFTEMMGQSLNYTDKFTLDGKECINEGMGGADRKSVVNWGEDKKSLIIKTKIPTEEFGEVEVTETLSVDESVLTVKSLAVSGMGELYEIFVFDKE